MVEQEGIRRESSQADPRGTDKMKNRMLPEGYGAIRCMFYIFAAGERGAKWISITQSSRGEGGENGLWRRSGLHGALQQSIE